MLWFHAVIWPAMLLGLKQVEVISGWTYQATCSPKGSGFAKAEKVEKNGEFRRDRRPASLRLIRRGWHAVLPRQCRANRC
ncbi:MAG: hypothetical protein E2581_15295 [Pseudomonas sp.]|nr:hypothetical protein [Pseudomonas sp.]HEN8732730.1 hypothetical protein [Pseudomonas putida]